jgi:hypothetical protein
MPLTQDDLTDPIPLNEDGYPVDSSVSAAPTIEHTQGPTLGQIARSNVPSVGEIAQGANDFVNYIYNRAHRGLDEGVLAPTAQTDPETGKKSWVNPYTGEKEDQLYTPDLSRGSGVMGAVKGAAGSVAEDLARNPFMYLGSMAVSPWGTIAGSEASEFGQGLPQWEQQLAGGALALAHPVRIGESLLHSSIASGLGALGGHIGLGGLAHAVGLVPGLAESIIRQIGPRGLLRFAAGAYTGGRDSPSSQPGRVTQGNALQQ